MTENLILPLQTFLFALLLNTHALAQQHLNIQQKDFQVSFNGAPNIDSVYNMTKTIKSWNNQIISIYHDNVITNVTQKKNQVPTSLNISASKRYIVLNHKLNFFDEVDFLFNSNDSISISYPKGYPLVTILNRDARKHDFDFEYIVKSKIESSNALPFSTLLFARHKWIQDMHASISSETKFKAIPPASREPYIRSEIEEFKKEIYPGLILGLNIELRTLDSLKYLDLISAPVYDFYRKRNKYNNYLADLGARKLTFNELREVLLTDQENYFEYNKKGYDRLLDAVVSTFLLDKANEIDLRDGINKDYRQLFDLISSSNNFGQQSKNYLLTKEINRIAQSFSRNDFLIYFKKYKQIVRDSTFVNDVESKFTAIIDDSSTSTTSVVLATSVGEKMTLDEIKERNKGKIIYIDFWASWCGPCRAAMPASRELRESLTGKDIVFVYLSIDTNTKAWQQAARAEHLTNYANSYLIVNSKSSDFLKQYKLAEIPRYMIFDKQGNLTHANAPRVESGEAALLLKRLADKR